MRTKLETAGRRGTSIPEICIGIVIVVMILGCLVAFQISASKSANKTSAANDGMQTVMAAMDVINDDLSSMIFQRRDDLHIGDDGRSITFLACKPLVDDLYKVPTERVSYTLEPLNRGGAPYRLIRTDSRGRVAIGGVLLANLECFLVVSGPPFKRQSRLEVTIVGWQTETKTPGFTATQTKAFAVAGRPKHGGGRRRRGGDKGGQS